MNGDQEEPNSTLTDNDRIKNAKQAVDRDNLILGRELYLAFWSGQYKTEGFKSFDDYAISKGVEPWRAKRLRRIFKKFSKDLGVSFDKMLAIGHERLKAIEPVINRSNRNLWLNNATTMNYPSLVQEVKKHKPIRKKRAVVEQPAGSQRSVYEPEDAGQLIKSITDERLKPSSDGTNVSDDDVVFVKKLYLIGSQNTVFETAIEDMERRTGSHKVGYLLTSALEEFLAHEATRGIKDDGRMRYFMHVLERRYKGKLLWIKDAKVAEELTAMLKEAERRVNDDQEGTT